MASSLLISTLASLPSAMAVFPMAFLGNTISPSFTLIRMLFPLSGSASSIQQPIMRQTSRTVPFTCTTLPTYFSGAAVSLSMPMASLMVNGLPSFTSPASPTATVSNARKSDFIVPPRIFYRTRFPGTAPCRGSHRHSDR